MSETCHPGIAYILQLYTEEQSRVDTALTHNVCHTSKEDGMRGMELPYQLRSDWMVTSVLFLCFILVSYVLAHGKKHLEQQFKNFALSKERASLFDDTTASDVRYTLVLILQTCILSGFCVYDYFSDHDLLLFFFCFMRQHLSCIHGMLHYYFQYSFFVCYIHCFKAMNLPMLRPPYSMLFCGWG